MTSRVLLDARWAGKGGIGRVTSQLAAGLAENPPEGDWTIWHRDPALVWDGAIGIGADRAPQAWAGQRAMFDVPSCDVAVFPANLRPLRPVGRASLTMLYDTIPVRHAKRRWRAAVSRGLFYAAAKASTQILTISDFSATTINEDLGVDPSRITVVPIPLARTLSDAVAARRPESLTDMPTIVYVGRFAPHKNLRRLVQAFLGSTTRANGGRLVLAGGSEPDVAAMTEYLSTMDSTGIEVKGQVSEDELVALYASAWVVAFVSLEEGFGLPVVEATAAGIPVVASTGGAIPEVVGDRMPLVDPTDVFAIADALDEAVGQSGSIDASLLAWTRSMPTNRDLATCVAEQVAGVL